MKKIIKLIVLSLIIALLNNAFSFLGELNLIWIVAAAVYVAEFELSGLIVAVLGGSLFDFFMHGNVGITGISILGGLIFYVLIYSLGVITNDIQKIVGLLVVFFLANLLFFFIEYVLGELSYYDWDIVLFSLRRTAINGILSVVVYMIAINWQQEESSKNVVKLK
jgi:hypothetical protein